MPEAPIEMSGGADVEAPPAVSAKFFSLSRYGVGVALICLVAVIWVGASEWIQWIFGDLKFNKPYFMTYFNTTGFCFWNLGFVTTGWRKVRWSESNDENVHLTPDSPQIRKYSIVELLRCAALFCPMWFVANCLFNYSLAATSVASNTILSSTSCIWTLALSRLVLNQDVTPIKIVSVVLVVGGTAMVALADNRTSGEHELAGDLIALLSAFFYAAYTTTLKWCLPCEDQYSMGMVFGFVGAINLATMWPGLILVDLLGIEAFEFPSWHVFWALGLNALIGTNLSDVLWAKSVVLTSPLVATLGLSLTTPLAMVADFAFKGKHFSLLYFLGALLVSAGFTVSNLTSFSCSS